MYKSINIDFHEVSEYFIGEAGKELDNLSRINIFIGPNNTGKSRFLRALFFQKKPDYKPQRPNFDLLNKTILNLINDVKRITEINRISSLVGCIQPQKWSLTYIPSDRSVITDWLKYCKSLSLVNESNLRSNLRFDKQKQIVSDLRQISEGYLDRFNQSNDDINKGHVRKNIYIPVLRGLRGVDLNQENKVNNWLRDNYKIRTIEDYFKYPVEAIGQLDDKIYTGLSLYEDVKKLLLSHAPNRNRIREFEIFLGTTFFEGQSFTIIPHIDDNVVHVKIGEAEDFPIYKLGEGVQAIIILTYPLFFNQGENINFFFEEPDINLHPGFQRVFLETLLLPKFDTFQYFFTTHSNHFLDMTLDFESISVYTFRKEANDRFQIANVKNDDHNILQMLGVKNSSVFLTNCTIWVEGITDRMYIRKYLSLIQKEKGTSLKEDIHFSFVEYGGGNITHWSFLDDADIGNSNIEVEKLCGTLFLITDQDDEKVNKKGEPTKKQLRQAQLKNRLGERYYCLESLEIENLLSEETLIKTIKDLEKNEAPKVDFTSVKLAKYKDKYLGKFIDDIGGLKRKYADKSGTIKQKVEFARTAINHIDSIDQMTEEAKDLSERVLDFIKKNNA